ncbi:S41 family peptidase [Pseudoalteromonas obscura]|uniref:S41 family peptidase n=1 Tax=Pseudoalteromonas obscura TaxID=3048491 RepID=A0ABT7EJ08_9GAMM|nr:S41 family peptidase [Pseudoalteromonas sp. P94(2023)]MDK2595010.1 S41 family peptidase [Pseudoalteromonas sp. P94(2023)]
MKSEHFIWFIFYLMLSSNLSANQAQKMSANQVSIAIETISNSLVDVYVNPNKGALAVDSLKTKMNRGSFRDGADFHWFKNEVYNALRMTTGDNSFELIHNTFAIELISKHNDETAVKSQISSDGVGYIELKGSFAFGVNSELVASHISGLPTPSALLLDLRTVDEGSIELSQTMLGYFIDLDQAIGLLQTNKGIEPIYAIQTPEFERFSDHIPLYILTSSFVSGPWELFIHALQESGRAVIIGEETMGLASIETLIQISEHITLSLTSGMLMSVKERISWHEQGVVPDHFSSSEKALDIALSLISERQ